MRVIRLESYLSGMFNPTVQLKSGGYIVIGVTEALVAIDVNSGRATKEGSIEETALKTNLEAAEEVARQLRLRDLAGLIVIDFIDMDERRNNAAVEKRMKDRLKTDRARIQVGRISGFGLMEMSRQRLRPGMIEATTQPCAACHGTGLIRSDDNLALSILRQVEEEGVRRRSREVLVKCPVGIANFLMNQKREHVAQIEARYGLSVRIEGDPMLISPDFTIEKFKTATRSVAEPDAALVVSAGASLMEDIDSEEPQQDATAPDAPDAQATTEETDGEAKPKKRRRRRRRRSKSGGNVENQTAESREEADGGAAPAESDTDAADAVVTAPEGPASEDKQEAETPTADTEKAPPKPKRTRARKTASATVKSDDAAQVAEDSGDAAGTQAETLVDPVEAPKKKPASRPRKKAAPKAAATTEVTDPTAAEAAAPASVETAPSDDVALPAADIPPAAAQTDADPAPAPDNGPKRRGWWSLGR